MKRNPTNRVTMGELASAMQTFQNLVNEGSGNNLKKILKKDPILGTLFESEPVKTVPFLDENWTTYGHPYGN